MAQQAQLKDTIFRVGDQVKVLQKIQEGDKVRNQPFEGIVIAIRGAGENKSFVVRKIAAGNIGVERIWPLNTPWIDKIEIVKKGKVRRAKLYFLRTAPKKLKFIKENQNKTVKKSSKKSKTSKK